MPSAHKHLVFPSASTVLSVEKVNPILIQNIPFVLQTYQKVHINHITLPTEKKNQFLWRLSGHANVPRFLKADCLRLRARTIFKMGDSSLYCFSCVAFPSIYFGSRITLIIGVDLPILYLKSRNWRGPVRLVRPARGV